MSASALKDSIASHRQEILALAARYGASNVRLFGSVARGDADETSDVDFVARFEPGRSLLDQGGLLMELRELLGVPVDLVSEGALTGRFGEIVRREAVPL
ncbi:MAG: nucleotidyltransferase family protein [Tepidisphaeraceae bacterium]